MQRPGQVNLLVALAVAFVVLLFYAEYSSIFALQVVATLGVIAATITAVIMFYRRSPQRKPGEQVSF